MPILQSEEYSGAGVCSYSPESPVGHIATRSDVASTGVGRKGDEPMRDLVDIPILLGARVDAFASREVRDLYIASNACFLELFSAVEQDYLAPARVAESISAEYWSSLDRLRAAIRRELADNPRDG